MKIIPEKNYRKPLYAIGLAAVMMTTALTGCADTTLDTEEDSTCRVTTGTSETEDIVELAGEETIETEEIIELAGDVVMEAPDT